MKAERNLYDWGVQDPGLGDEAQPPEQMPVISVGALASESDEIQTYDVDEISPSPETSRRILGRGFLLARFRPLQLALRLCQGGLMAARKLLPS